MISNSDFEKIVVELYQGLLNREPDDGALRHYSEQLSSGQVALRDVCKQICRADEFLGQVLRERDLSIFRLSEVARNARYGELSQAPEYEAMHGAFHQITEADFEPAYQSTLGRHPSPQFKEYVTLHKLRLMETLSFVGSLSNPSGAMLEVSTSPYTHLMKQKFLGRVVTADHASIHPGVSDTPLPAINSDFHVAVDLNSEGIAQRVRATSDGGFDVVLFCEIIEHLLPSPYDLVRDLGACLKPGGKLLISTPNFFSFDRAVKMMHRQHPNALLAAGDSFARGAHHVREYAMDELIHIAREAGLKVAHYGFSACWDQHPLVKDFVDLHPAERTCLMVVCERV
jgi:SAM-dependent methyltransferase